MLCPSSQFALGCLCALAIVTIQILLISRSFPNVNEKLPCGRQAAVTADIQLTYADEDASTTDIPNLNRLKRDKTRRLPSAIIIGVRKGGTRALLDALSLHPNVRAARREIHFFDQNDTYQLGSEWYRQQMPYSNAGQITIEKSPGYITSPLAAKRVYDVNPDMKLIVIVRDPVVRTISDFTQVFYTKLERNKAQARFEDVAFLKNSSVVDESYKPIRNSLYAKHLKHWLDIFPRSQFLIVDGDRFIVDPLSEPVSTATKQRLAKNFRPHNRRFYALVNQYFNWQ
ncbi:sulfotransferase domain-containing protein [Aphelenchoides avenae]|nr:sulfotransferase domain-containing protein [Aphelenchus avenae]